MNAGEVAAATAAATALAKYLPTVAATNSLVAPTLPAVDRFLAHSDPAVRAAILPGLIGLLNAPVSMKRELAERLGRLGAEG